MKTKFTVLIEFKGMGHDSIEAEWFRIYNGVLYVLRPGADRTDEFVMDIEQTSYGEYKILTHKGNCTNHFSKNSR